MMSIPVDDGVNTLLKMGGFSKKSHKRLVHLSPAELDALCIFRPIDNSLWPSFVREIQQLLSKMNVARKKEIFLCRPPFMGRPYLSIPLARNTCQLSCLRRLKEIGFNNHQSKKLRLFLRESDASMLFTLFHELVNERDTLSTKRTINLLSAIQFMELYRDALITPPRRERRQLPDEDEVDDASELYWESMRHTSSPTNYDVPDFHLVLDWFFSMRPALDKNQLKRGWAYLKKSSDEWHQSFQLNAYYPETLSENLSWNCLVAERHDAWLAVFPTGNPFKLVPITKSQQLLEESQAMRHCVVTYLENCMSGDSRIFSVRKASNNQRIATAELSLHSGHWKLEQLRGKFNRELIHRTGDPSDPLAIALDVLVGWYNKNAPA